VNVDWRYELRELELELVVFRVQRKAGALGADGRSCLEKVTWK